jgi:hypothetical protein
MMGRKTPAVGFAVVVCAAAAFASADPTLGTILRKDQGYARARHTLKASGWRPVLTEDRDPDGTRVKSYGDTRRMSEAGMVEVERCTGVGLNFCDFWWRKSRSCLHVTTYGEYVPERRLPRVSTYRIEACRHISEDRKS